MSTYASLPSAPLGLRPASTPAHKGVDGIQRRNDSARGLSVMLLAAVVAAMVVVADRLISTWADGQLFLAWVFLWVVVFAGMALFADTARSLARRAVVSLDGWSQALAEARAETRLWEMARMDHRLMNELVAARARAADESEVQARWCRRRPSPKPWRRWACPKPPRPLNRRWATGNAWAPRARATA